MDYQLTWQQAALTGLCILFIAGLVLILAAILPLGTFHGYGLLISGIILLAFAAAGIRPVWRSHRLAGERSKLREMAEHGAIVRNYSQRSDEMSRVSGAIRDRFGIPPRTVNLPTGEGIINAGDLYIAVWDALATQEIGGTLTVHPEAIARARLAIEKVLQNQNPPATFPSISLGTPLAKLLRRSRIGQWQSLSLVLGQPLPPLEISSTAAQIIGWICAAAAIGIMVPIAQWLDREHPVEKSSVPRGVGRILGLAVFIVILFPLMWLAIRLLRRFLVSFPSECRIFGQLVAVAGAATPPQGTMGGWTAELLWSEIRDCVAESFSTSPEQITPDFPLTYRAHSE